MFSKKQDKPAPKQYFEHVPRRAVYGVLVVFAIVAAATFLFVPHYKPLALATVNQTDDANRAVIMKYFVKSTVCKDDNRGKIERIQTFNKYFATNKYANRAVIRGCNDKDTMLFKDDQGRWQKSEASLVLSGRQNPEWQKACLIDDITSKETSAIDKDIEKDKRNVEICESLAKESYIEVNFKQGIQFNF